MPTDQHTIKAMFDRGLFAPFIQYIRFPLYKNLAPNTKIEFTHPITALVGANGTNKSSVLKALYGVPGQNNVGNLWFSTSLDPIEEGDGGPNCFIYGYHNEEANKTVEVLKTRIFKENDPDYWEPSRPLKKYDMEPFGRRAVAPAGGLMTRWKNLTKKVVYVDFRSALSAFDKFFYYGQIHGKEIDVKNKKEIIRRRSSALKLALDSGSTSYTLWVERIVNKENSTLGAAEVKDISAILGRSYKSIKLIRHSFYTSDGYTALMESDTHNYSEAFAGSGEFSVISLVYAVHNSSDASLILLDEPEVSLHPGAQERLMAYLARQSKLHKHQIVISTHSPALIRPLPPDAIKLLVIDPNTGKVMLPSQTAHPEEAFFHLGEPIPGIKQVIVEDKLAKALVERVIRKKGQAAALRFKVVYYPGGVNTLWNQYAPIFAAEGRKDVMLLIDGDQNPGFELPDTATIPVADLEKTIRDFTHSDVKFAVDATDGDARQDQLAQVRKNFIQWAKKFVRFLPSQTPEEFLWEHMIQDANSRGVTDADYKDKFVSLTKIELALADYESPKSEEILQTQKRKIATIPDDNDGLLHIEQSLDNFAAAH